MIGKSLSQRYAERDHRLARRVCARCTVCGEQTPFEVEAPPHVGRTTIEHASDCPFWLAVAAGLGEQWVEANYYPIEFVSPLGVA